MTDSMFQASAKGLPSAAPARLNGYPVTMATCHENGFVTVMVDVSPDNKFTPFCVATYWPDLNNGWQWGHYEANAEDANATYASVSKRNAARGRL